MEGNGMGMSVYIFLSLVVGIVLYTLGFSSFEYGTLKDDLRYYHVFLFLLFPASMVIIVLFSLAYGLYKLMDRPLFKDKDNDGY